MREFVLAAGALAAGIGAALALGRHGSRRRRRLGEIDPYAATGEPEIDEADFEIAPGSYSDPDNPTRPNRDEPAWEGGCLRLGNKHFRYGGAYRVCLTANQEQKLFDNKRTKLRKLGCGVFACAYEAPTPNRVIKLTRDPEDVAALLKAQKTGVVAEVYSVFKLAQGGRTDKFTDPMTMRTIEPHPVDVYAMEVERLRPVPADEREIVQNELFQLQDALDNAPLDKACQQVAKMNARNGEPGGCTQAQKDVLAAIRKLAKLGIKWSDFHTGNFGYNRNGKFRVLDLGVSKTKLEHEPEILAGIQRRARAQLARKPLHLVP